MRRPHPLHPALVHFPVACWSLATLGDIASLQLGEKTGSIANILLVTGMLTALAAMLAGLLEFTKLEADSSATVTANKHMLLATLTWGIYAVSLYLRLDGAVLLQPDLGAIGLSVTGFISLCATGWLGGKLVYQYGIGVSK
jgi:uncharacterized membrane protein